MSIPAKVIVASVVFSVALWGSSASADKPKKAQTKTATKAGKKAKKKKKDPVVELFVRKCAACHTVGKGDMLGPDLKDVHKRRKPAWIQRMITTPSEMLTTDAEARKLLKKFNNLKMPDLGLPAPDVKKLIALLKRCSVEECDLSAKFTPAVKATKVEINLGRELFVGRTRLKNGGPACISCHTVRGVGGVLGGGELSKDLTHAFARLSDAGLDAALRGPTFKLMNRIFKAHPLEDEEVFGLRAFLYHSNRQPSPSGHGYNLLLLGILGAVLSIVILRAAWPHRLRGD